MIEPSPSASKPDASIAAVAARLEDFLANYLADAERLGISVSAAQVAGAIDEASRRCRGGAAPAEVGGTVEAIFLDGISAALVEEREGVCEKQTAADGEEVWRAVDGEVWAQCLAALRASVEKLSQP